MFPSSCLTSALSSLDSIAQISDLAKTKATHGFGLRLISLGSNFRALGNSSLLVYVFTKKIFMKGLLSVRHVGSIRQFSSESRRCPCHPSALF